MKIQLHQVDPRGLIATLQRARREAATDAAEKARYIDMIAELSEIHYQVVALILELGDKRAPARSEYGLIREAELALASGSGPRGQA